MSTATVVMAVDLLLQLMQRGGQISAVIEQARAEGRDTLTAEEWAQITAQADAARARLAAALQGP